MSTYITFGTNDFAASAAFYDAVLATIGWQAVTSFKGWRCYGKDGKAEPLAFWICEPFDGGAATAGNGVMMGFEARSRDEVDAFYRTAMALGGTDEGGPGHPRQLRSGLVCRLCAGPGRQQTGCGVQAVVMAACRRVRNR